MIRPERETDDAREVAALRDALRRASRDAPRRDLWPRLEAEVLGSARRGGASRARRRWHWPIRPFRALAPAALSLALVAALVVWAWSFGRQRDPAVAVGTVPETLLALSYQSVAGTNTYDVAAYRPGEAATRRPLLEGANGVPLVAPDGQQLLFIEQRVESQTVRTALVAHASDTLARQWSVPLGEQPLSELAEHLLVSRIAVVGDRIYAATFHLGLGDPLIVRVLARFDGATVATWPIATEGRILNEVTLLAAPSGGRLHLFARLATDQSRQAAVQDRHVAIGLPDGRQEARSLTGDLLAATALYGAGGRIAPDGRTFYRLTYEGRVVFFDLERDTRPTALPLPFASVAGGLIPLGQGITPDGRTLYALAPLVGQLAIIDLPGRRIERVVQLGGLPQAKSGEPAAAWDRLREWLVPGADASGNFTATIQVSPDGRRLYAVGASGGAAGGRLGGVWVIATDDWRIVEHWRPGETVSGLLLIDQGRSLLVHSGERVRLLAVASGQVTAELAEPAIIVTSLGELYREQHGRAPGHPPGVPTEVGPVARP